MKIAHPPQGLGQLAEHDFTPPFEPKLALFLARPHMIGVRPAVNGRCQMGQIAQILGERLAGPCRNDREQRRYAVARRQCRKIVKRRGWRNCIVIAQPQACGDARIPPAIKLITQDLPRHGATVCSMIAASLVIAALNDLCPWTKFRAAVAMRRRSRSSSSN